MADNKKKRSLHTQKKRDKIVVKEDINKGELKIESVVVKTPEVTILRQ